MTPGERIALIRESGRLLEPMEWMEIDLVLKQHNLPFTDDWGGAGGDKYAYVIEMIQDADESSLRQLHTYLVGDSDEVPEEAQPWTPGYLKLFMSHLAIHQAFVGQVSNVLAGEGVSGFVAHTSIEPSREWMEVIETGLRSCDAMVVFLHEGFHESKWCDQEVGFALAKRVPVLLLAYEVMPYGFMSKFQALRASGVDVSTLAWQVKDWLYKTPTAQEPMTEGLVSAFEHSNSFDRTRWLLPQLQNIPRFTPKQLERLDAATRSNSQIAHANADFSGTSVPSVIRALISKHGGKTSTPQPPSDPWSTDPPF